MSDRIEEEPGLRDSAREGRAGGGGGGGKERTSWVVARLVRALPPDAGIALAEHEEDDPPPEHDDEPVPPRPEPAHVLAELELGDGLLGARVPQDDLVGRVERGGGPADEEEEVGALEGEDDAERGVGEVCLGGTSELWSVQGSRGRESRANLCG